MSEVITIENATMERREAMDTRPQDRYAGRLKFACCRQCGSDFGMRSMEREVVAMLCPDAIASLAPWYEEPDNDLVLYYPCFVCNYLGERIPDAWEKLEAEEDVLEWCKQPDPMAPDYGALAAEPEPWSRITDSRESAGLEE